MISYPQLHNMSKISLSCPLALLLIAAPAVMAQQTQAAQAKPAAPAAVVQKAHPKSKAESDALKALQKLYRDPATTPDQMDAAVTDFVTKYPTSDYLAEVNAYAVQFYQSAANKNYDKTLVYGEQALKADPTDLYVLATLADNIPNNVKDTDLDRDQRLKEAADDAQQLLKIASTSGATINGQPFPQAARNEAEATAYSSLARIANLGQDYPNVVANYAKAIPLDAPGQQAVDYFYTARAQIAMKQWDAALASLDACSKAAPDNPGVQKAVQSNRASIAQQRKAGGGI